MYVAAGIQSTYSWAATIYATCYPTRYPDFFPLPYPNPIRSKNAQPVTAWLHGKLLHITCIICNLDTHDKQNCSTWICLVHRQCLRQISCMIRTGIRRYQGKAWGSAFLPPLISPWSGSKLEINIDLAFMIFFSSIFSFHDLCDIFIISPNVRSPALPHIVLVPFLACIYETLIGHTSVVCKFWICNVYICIKW